VDKGHGGLCPRVVRSRTHKESADDGSAHALHEAVQIVRKTMIRPGSAALRAMLASLLA